MGTFQRIRNDDTSSLKLESAPRTIDFAGGGLRCRTLALLAALICGVATQAAHGQSLTITTSTSLTSISPNPSFYGTYVTFTGTVTAPAVTYVPPTPTGSISLTVDGIVVDGSVALGSDGSFSFSTNGLTPGTHSIVATYPETPYNADENFGPSTSPTYSQTVIPAYGPPATGRTSSILFVPGTLNLVSGLNGLGYGGDNGPANSGTVQLNFPSGVAYDTNGNLFVADSGNYVVREIVKSSGNIVTFAGTEGTEGFSANGGTALGAQFGTLSGLIIDSRNNIYVSDETNGVVWEITSAGGISIFAGGGSIPGDCNGGTDSIGDGCLAIDASLNYPTGLAFDAFGNLYIADSHNYLVREVNASTGTISTFAGNVGDSDDGGCPTALYTTSTGPWTPTEAHLCFPYGVGFDSNGNFYVAESQRDLIRIVTQSNGDITTFAGGGSGTCTGATDSNGDGCPATDAILSFPQGLYVDPTNRVYVADEGGSDIRMVDTSGNISIVLGGNGSLVKNSIGEPDTEEVLVNNSPVGAANGIDFFTMDPNGDIIATDADSGAVTSAGSSGGYVFPETPIYTTETTTAAHTFSTLFPPYILISNPSGVPLNLNASPVVTGPFGIVTGTGAGTCTFPGTVAPGASCTLVASFTPTAGNNAVNTGTIAIGTNVGNSPSIINLSGLGSGSPTPGATLTPNPVPNFTSPAFVTSAAQDVTLTNTGTTPLIVGSTDFDGFDPSNFGDAGTTCPTSPATLGIGDSCYFQITFTPTAATTYSAGFQVDVEYNSATGGLVNYGYVNTSLSGTRTAGTPAATPVISPAGGTYNAPVAVQITDSSTNPTIYYTTTGITPSPSSPTYSGVFTVATTGAEVQAVATAPGDFASNPATPATYTIQSYLSFNSAAVGIAAGSAQTLTAAFSLAGTTAPTAVLHYGHDYSLGSVSCTPNGGIEVCTVPVTFIPTLPGARKDALFLMISTTQVASVLLGGVGQAPLSLVQPGVVTNPILNASGYNYDSTVDENGTAYVQQGTSVYKVTKAGAVFELPITGLNGPEGIAIDGAGILYIGQGDYGLSLVTYNTVTGVQGTLNMVPPSPYIPCASSGGGAYEGLYGIAADDIGDIFALDNLCNQIFELKPDGTYVVDNINPSITQPGYLAVDSAGNVFVSGYTINDIPASGTQTEINTTGASQGLAVDAADTLYATRYSAGTYDVAELPATGYGTPLAGLDGGTTGEIVSPLGLSLGSDGTLFVGDYGNLDKVDRTQGAIAFGEQSVNVASSAKVVGIYNGGNRNLTLSSLAISGTGFTMVPDANNGCTANLVIAPGQLCNVDVTANFPNAGTFSGTVTFTTNSLNTTSTTQTVNLSGFVYGPYVTATTPPPFGNQNIGTQTSTTVTLTNSGDLYTAELNISGTTVPPGFIITNGTGAGSCSNVEDELAPGASCTITVNFNPDAAIAYSGTVSIPVASSGGGGPWPDATFPVSGTGITPLPPASLSPSPLAFGGQVLNTTSPAQIVTLTNNGDTQLIQIVPSIVGANPSDFTLQNGINACTATLAAGVSCSFYISFTPASPGNLQATLSIADSASNSPQTITLTGTGIQFVSNVGTAQAAQAVTVYLATAGTASAINVLTQGAAGLDFTQAEGGTCATATSYTVGETCTVNVIFTPQFAGIRNGSVLLTDASGNALGTAYLPGVGNGPQIAFTPAVQSNTLPASTYAPLGVTLDADGNLYIADNKSNGVYKFPRNGSGYGSAISVGSGYNEPTGVAVDGAGNVYVGNYAGENIVKIPWTGSAYGPQTTVPLGPGAHQPRHLAVDGFGNIFFADYVGGVVNEVPWTGSGYGTLVVLPFTGINSPNDVQVDQNGDVFCADTYGHNVLMLPKTSSGFGTQVTVVSGLTGLPIGIALDPHGDVYAADQLGGSDTGEALLEVPFADGAYGAPVTIPVAGLAGIWDVALDGAGNIYVADFTAQQVFKLDVSDPPSLSFASTNVGSTSTDSPKTVAVTNIGNAQLYFNAADNNPVYPADFPINNSDNNLCQEDSSVFPGMSCDVSVNFKPTTPGSPLSEQIVLTDNNLNGASVTQSIPVSGIGLFNLIAQAINFTQPTTPVTWASGLTIPLVATGGASENPVVFTVDPSSTPGAGAVNGSILTVNTPGTIVIDANQAGNSLYSPATQVQRTVVVNQATPVLAWLPPAGIAYGIPLSSAQLNATVTGVGGATLPGKFTYTPPAGTVLAPGPQTLTVSFVPSDAVDYTNVSGSVHLVVSSVSLSSISPGSVNLGAGNTTITLTGAGFVATSVAQVNGIAIPTTLVSPTTLTAVIPAADFIEAATLQITVFDPTITASTAALPFMVTNVPLSVTLSGPSAAPSGSDTSPTFTLINPYPLPLTVTLTLAFTPSVTPPVDDPAIQFSNGSTTLTFVVPANSTVTPPIQIQVGTVAGTITITPDMKAGGVDVTPSSLLPIVIDVPGAVPSITSASITRDGDQLTVVMNGFSNTREVTQATFQFLAAPGTQIETPDITLQVGPIFTDWFSSTPSDQYGSTFTYTQIFNVNNGAAEIGSVQITLTNSVGVSESFSTQ